MEKYIQLMEKYIQLMEKYIQLMANKPCKIGQCLKNFNLLCIYAFYSWFNHLVFLTSTFN